MSPIPPDLTSNLGFAIGSQASGSQGAVAGESMDTSDPSRKPTKDPQS
ncbi:jg16548, partial [Pararge aegeria aegeria]